MSRLAARPLGLAIALVGLASAVAVLSIGGWDSGAWGPRTVPLLASLLLVLCGAADALLSPRSPSAGEGTVRVNKGDPPGTAHDGSRDGSLAGDWRVAALLGLAVLYVLAIDRIGYLAATALVSPCGFALFGVRRPLALLAATLIVPLALHVAFFRLLGVFPPFGRWFDVLDVVPL